jgi:hypothetical protein
MHRIISIAIIISITLTCCKNSTDTSEIPKGQIYGKVYNSLTNQSISRLSSLTLSKLSSQGLSYDSLRSTLSDSLGHYSFSGLDFGDYSVRSNTDSYFKTGYVVFVSVSANIPNQVLDVPIDTVITRPH